MCTHPFVGHPFFLKSWTFETCSVFVQFVQTVESCENPIAFDSAIPAGENIGDILFEDVVHIVCNLS